MTASTTPFEGNDGYGHLWWLYDEGAFAARGIFQQWIFIDPERDLVIAAHNNALKATQDEDYEHVREAILALREAIAPE
jgi:CubicO group peptidase (beta-lactamase class C family)